MCRPYATAARSGKIPVSQRVSRCTDGRMADEVGIQCECCKGGRSGFLTRQIFARAEALARRRPGKARLATGTVCPQDAAKICALSTRKPMIMGGDHARVETRIDGSARRYGVRGDSRTGAAARQDSRVMGGAGRQLGLDPAGKEGPRAPPRQVLHPRADALCRYAADDHGARQQRAGGCQPGLFDPGDCGGERRHERSARHRR